MIRTGGQVDSAFYAVFSPGSSGCSCAAEPCADPACYTLTSCNDDDCFDPPTCTGCSEQTENTRGCLATEEVCALPDYVSKVDDVDGGASGAVLLGTLGADGHFAAFCSGVLVDDLWILTAAHCADAIATVDAVPVRFGSQRDDRLVEKRIAATFEHPGFDASACASAPGENSCDADAMLIPMCLPRRDSTYWSAYTRDLYHGSVADLVGTTGDVFGHGARTEVGFEYLRGATLPVKGASSAFLTADDPGCDSQPQVCGGGTGAALLVASAAGSASSDGHGIAGVSWSWDGLSGWGTSAFTQDIGNAQFVAAPSIASWHDATLGSSYDTSACCTHSCLGSCFACGEGDSDCGLVLAPDQVCDEPYTCHLGTCVSVIMAALSAMQQLRRGWVSETGGPFPITDGGTNDASRVWRSLWGFGRCHGGGVRRGTHGFHRRLRCDGSRRPCSKRDRRWNGG